MVELNLFSWATKTNPASCQKIYWKVYFSAKPVMNANVGSVSLDFNNNFYKFSCKIMFFSFLYSTRIVCGSFSSIIMWKCCCTLHVPISKQQKWRNVNKFCWKLDILHPMTPFCCSTFLWFSSGWLLLFWKQKRVHWGWFLGQLENWNRHNGMCSCIKIRMALQDWALKQKNSNCSWLKSSVDISYSRYCKSQTASEELF